MQHISKDNVFNRLAALPDEAGRIEFLSRHPRLLCLSTVRRLDERVSVLLRVDLRKAHALAEAAVTIANQLNDKEAQAFAVRAKANALWFLGENRQAKELHAEAIQLFTEHGDRLETARTLSTSIQPLILLGEYGRAHAAAEQARDIFTQAGETMRLARLEINVGNIFHRQDRFQEALECYERALAQLLPGKDNEGIIAAHHNLAVCLIMLNDYQRALYTYEQVCKFCLQKNMPLAVAQAKYNIAYLHYLRGAYGRAIEMLGAARTMCERVGDAYHVALCQLDLSEIYVELNMNEEAAELAAGAFSRFQQLGMGYEAAKALCNSAIALAQQGESFRALKLFAQAREIFVKEKNQVWPSLINLYQALVYFNEGRLPEAQRRCLAALDFFRNSPLPGRAALCHLLLARLSLKAGNLEAAHRNCQTALDAITGKEMPILAYQAHFVMGQIDEAGGDLQQAKGHYRIAKEFLEKLRSGIHGEELKIFFMRNRLEVYEVLVDLSLMLGSVPHAHEEAWTYMEHAKSRNLLELLTRRANPAPANGREETALARRIAELREQLNWYYHRIEIEQMGQVPASDERLVALRHMAEEREKEFRRAVRELPATETAALEYAVPLSLDAVRKVLGPQSVLVEYFRIRDRVLAAIVSLDGVEIISVTLTSRIAQVLRMLQFQFSKFALGPNYLQKFQGPLHEATLSHLGDLYTELIAPIRAKLKCEHLVVVPHESLHYVPFHALFDGQEYLIDSYTVSYAPSANIYAECCQKRSNGSVSSLALGVPDQRAPHIADEVQSVAALLPQAKLFLGPDASERALTENGAHSRWIHIATHGSFRQDNPMLSGIRLADTFLTLYDLYHLKLPADLVTLSGCSTGLNVVAAGDELLGLMRGLLAAGARSLLLSLWDVNDRSTAEFMKSFYGRLLAGPNLASAFRGAMQEVRERYPHPYYWAPFLLVGNALL